MVRFGTLPSAKAQSGSRLDPCRGKRPQHIPVQTGRKSSLRYLPACEGGVVVIVAYLCSFKTDCTLQLWCGYLDSKVYSVKTAVLVPSVPAGLCESLIDLDRIIWTCEISAGRTISDLCLRIPCWDKSAVQDLWQEYAHQYPNTSSRRNAHHMKMHEEDAIPSRHFNHAFMVNWCQHVWRVFDTGCGLTDIWLSEFRARATWALELPGRWPYGLWTGWPWCRFI